MRRWVSGMVLMVALTFGAATAAHAEDGDWPGEKTSPPTDVVTAKPSTRSGAGGGLFIGAQTLAGVLTGGMIGGSYGFNRASTSEGIYFGSITAGLLLGGMGAVYQHFVPVHASEATLSSLAGLAGGLAGFGFASALRLAPGPGIFWAIGIGTQAGMWGSVLLTSGAGALSAGDVWMMALGTVYAASVATVTTTLIQGNTQPDAAFLALSPAFGLGVGALFAVLLEGSAGRVLAIGAPPLGVGLTFFYFGSVLSKDPRVGAVAGLAGMGGSLLLAVLLSIGISSSDTAPSEESKQSWLPSVVPSPWVVAGDKGSVAGGLSARGVF